MAGAVAPMTTHGLLKTNAQGIAAIEYQAKDLVERGVQRRVNAQVHGRGLLHFCPQGCES